MADNDTGTDIAVTVGRPRAFDRDAVLDTVVQLFWQTGFAGTSIGDVVEHTGLSTSSLYGTFGSKEQLFAAAIDRYLAQSQATIETLVRDGQRGLDDIDAFFDHMRGQVESAGDHRGCLAVNTATERGTADPALVAVGVRHRAFVREAFAAALERAAERDEFEPRQIAVTADLLVTTVLGLAVMIRGGAALDEIVRHLDAVKTSLRTR